MKNINGDFKAMIKRFLKGNRLCYTDGDWSITKNGYSNSFDVIYNGRVVISCINSLMVGHDVEIKGTNEFIDTKKYMGIILEESKGLYYY